MNSRKNQPAHVITSALGIILVFSIFNYSTIYLILLSINTWTAIQIARKHSKKIGPIITIICAIFGILMFCTKQNFRFFQTQLVIIMKIISIALDLERKPKEKLPPIEEYLAYIFCPGTTIFGVWVSFTDFQKSIRNLKRNEISHGKMYRTIGLALLWSLLWALLGFHTAFYLMECYISKVFIIQSGYKADILTFKFPTGANDIWRGLNYQNHLWFRKCKFWMYSKDC